MRALRWLTGLVAGGLIAAAVLLDARQQPVAPAGTDRPAVRYVPDDLQETSWLSRLQKAQLASLQGAGTFRDFSFSDRIAESGITFRHRIVDDAGRTYKAAHYDHGNGLAIGDIDADGRSDLYFVNQVGGNELWRNAGGGRFENVTAAAGVALADRVNVAASFADVDNDGDDDLYVTSVRAGNVLFENDGKGRFRDITAAAGLAHRGHSSSALFFDYDRDGRLDLLLVNVGRYTTDVVAGEGYRYFVAFEDAFSGHLKPERAERSILYRNLGGGRFADVSKATGLVDTAWTGDATILDGNDDGWPDVYFTNMQGDDQYYENARGAKFVRRGPALFPRTSWGAMGVKVLDVNNDGRLDLFVTDMHSDMSETIPPEREKLKSEMKWPVEFRGTGATSIWGNTLFVKEGPGKYREASDAFNLENYCPWGPSVGDLNADGWDDVFITAGMNYPERYMINSAKLNDGGKRFLDAEFALGIEPRRGGVATPFFTLDASGRDRGHRDAVGERGAIEIWGARGSRSSAVFDLDADGDLDIVTNEFHAAPMVLISDLAARTRVRYLQVKLTGTVSNRSALGSVVRVIAGGSTYVKVLDGNSGYLSHGVYPLYFGLGAAEAIDRVEVTWPSGARQTVTGPVPLNSTLAITEEKGSGQALGR